MKLTCACGKKFNTAGEYKSHFHLLKPLIDRNNMKNTIDLLRKHEQDHRMVKAICCKQQFNDRNSFNWHLTVHH